MKKKMILNTIQRDFINPDGIDKHYDNLTYINRVVIGICYTFAATTHTFNLKYI